MRGGQPLHHVARLVSWRVRRTGFTMRSSPSRSRILTLQSDLRNERNVCLRHASPQAPNIGRKKRAVASEARRSGRPFDQLIIPPLMTFSGLYEELRFPQHQVGDFTLLDRTDVVRHAEGDGRIDGGEVNGGLFDRLVMLTSRVPSVNTASTCISLGSCRRYPP